MKRLTKIIATISDKNCSVKFLKKLRQAGMDVARLNTAHQDIKSTDRIVKNIRKVSEKIPIIIDTKGPEIRTHHETKEISVKKGMKIKIARHPADGHLAVTYNDFVDDVPVGSKILIDDGEVEIIVTGKENKVLEGIVQNMGVIKAKKSINVPGVKNNLPALTKKDKEYIEYAIKNNIDFIAHSFVRNKKDVQEIQKILDKRNSKLKIIAKIENHQGVENIDEILDQVYGLMIARGDLGVEIPIQKIPGIQKRIIARCIRRKKPVIIATQMLHSMIFQPRPTRAEVSDVATGVYDCTDAIMLSGETSIGKYPVKAVQTAASIAIEVESQKKGALEFGGAPISNEIADYLAKAAVKATKMLPVKAIITDTITGRTARYLSSYRGKVPVYSQCYDKRIMRELALSFGVYTEYMKPRNTAKEFTDHSLKQLLKKKAVKKKDLILVVAGSFGPSNGASYVEIAQVFNLLK